MSYAEKSKEKVRRRIIDLYEGKVREIAEETGYSEEYVRRHLMSGRIRR